MPKAYQVPAASVPGDYTGASPATVCSVIGRGADDDLAPVLGRSISEAVTWTFEVQA